MQDEDNPIRDMIHEMAKRQKVSNQIGEELEEKADVAEKEILMRFWGELGNSKHNYYIALQAAGLFVKALKKARTANQLPHDMAVYVIKALSDCLLMDIECMEIAKAIKEKHGYEED